MYLMCLEQRATYNDTALGTCVPWRIYSDHHVVRSTVYEIRMTLWTLCMCLWYKLCYENRDYRGRGGRVDGGGRR